MACLLSFIRGLRNRIAADSGRTFRLTELGHLENTTSLDSALLNLPSELIHEIISHLDLKDMKSCRLVNKYMRAHAKISFKKYLSKYRVALTGSGLRTFLEISQHRQFRFAIQKVGIEPVLMPIDLSGYNTETLEWMTSASELPPPFAPDYTVERIWESVAANFIALLTKAFSLLPRLHTVYLYLSACDHMLKLPNGVERNLTQLTNFRLHAVVPYTVTLGAIIGSGKQLRNFSWISYLQQGSMGIDAAALYYTIQHQESVRHTFQNLTNLNATLSQDANSQGGKSLLAEVLHLMPALQALSLIFEYPNDCSENYILEGLCDASPLGKLSHLQLWSTGLPTFSLYKGFIKKHLTTLESLSVHKLDLSSPHDMEKIQMVIVPFLKMLRDESVLENLHLGILWDFDEEEHGVRWERLVGVWPGVCESGRDGVRKYLQSAIEALEEEDEEQEEDEQQE
ncbi:hypothetical protein EJ08DRAFT_661573 [Tothia fuscella]|uniref:F-box domain-containing protein n=1 Tax=Tothia fuscella TaxID=1048955 RepID=A0A9P4TY97_9PEZI|nr:hypothetical protein EJ08DRAFT_661573 [Tothia fuscella]